MKLFYGVVRLYLNFVCVKTIKYLFVFQLLKSEPK